MTPGQPRAPGDLINDGRWEFLKAVRRRVPRVLNTLAAKVLPLYNRGEEDTREWLLEYQSDRFKEALVRWANEFSLNVEWVLFEAIEACYWWDVRDSEWTDDSTERPPTISWGGRVVSAPRGVVGVNPWPTNRSFAAQWFHWEARDKAEARILGELHRWMDQLMELSISRGFVPEPESRERKLSSRDRWDALALHQCGGWDLQWIAERLTRELHTPITRQAVSKHLVDLGKLIGLPPRDPSRRTPRNPHGFSRLKRNPAKLRDGKPRRRYFKSLVD